MSQPRSDFRLAPLVLLVVLTVVVGLGTIAVWRHSQQLDRLVCVERLHATAAVASMVPDTEIDIAGRVAAAQQLGAQISEC